jgi:hypothetical protein
MDESVNVVFRNSLSNSLNAFHMDILKIKILGGVASANEIVHHIRVSDAFFERWGISQVIFLEQVQKGFRKATRTSYHEYNPSQISSNLQMTLGHLFSERHNNRTSLPRCAQLLVPRSTDPY